MFEFEDVGMINRLQNLRLSPEQVNVFDIQVLAINNCNSDLLASQTI